MSVRGRLCMNRMGKRKQNQWLLLGPHRTFLQMWEKSRHPLPPVILPGKFHFKFLSDLVHIKLCLQLIATLIFSMCFRDS